MGLAEKVVGYDVFVEKSGISVPEYRLIEGKLKLKKNGTPKKIVCNAKTGRSSWVDPIKNVEDIGKIIDYMNMRIENAGRADYEWQWERNKLYFILAVFSGFRVSDLVGARPGTKYKKTNKETGEIWYEYPRWTGLRWCDLYEKDGVTLKDVVTVKELKTSKRGGSVARTVKLSNDSKAAILHYVEKYRPKTNSDDYVFLNRRKERLHADTVEDFIKEVTEACGLKGNYSTHSIRKTCVYTMYQGLAKKYGDESAIGKCMRFTGHKSIQAFFSYLGIERDNTGEMMGILENELCDVLQGKL